MKWASVVATVSRRRRHWDKESSGRCRSVPRPVTHRARRQNVQVGKDDAVIVPGPHVVSAGGEVKHAPLVSASPDWRLNPEEVLPIGTIARIGRRAREDEIDFERARDVPAAPTLHHDAETCAAMADSGAFCAS